MQKILGVRLLSMVLVGATTALIVSLGLATTKVNAADNMSVNSRLAYGVAANYCENWAKGMVWLSNNTSNYYSEDVNVAHNATTASVQVRGALNTCDTLMDDRKENRALAGDVESKTPSVLTISGTSFYRGSVPSLTANAWTTKGNYLNAQLDVSGVAVCKGVAETLTGTVQVQIYRKLVWEKIEYDNSVHYTEGGAGTETIDVPVKRTCPEVVRPKVRILGGDLLVHGKVTTSTSAASGRTYGSWSEYAIVSEDAVKGMASGSGYVGGSTTPGSCSVSLLTFANTDASGCPASTLGNYGAIGSSPADQITSLLKALPSQANIAGSISLDSLTGDTVFNANSNITLSAASAMPQGKWVVIMAEGKNVTISTDITYQNGSYTSANDIPQLVIIAKNIIIKDSVGRVDAWLIANDSAPNGVVRTCDVSGVSLPGGLTRNVCNKRLALNGPVMARSVKLYRTHSGSAPPAISEYAESFNLRADAYLWATNLVRDSSRLTTVNVKELAPRF